MAKNITLDGLKRVTVTAPASVNAGAFVQVGQMGGVALTSAVSAAPVVLSVGPTATLKKINAASTSFVEGALLYWDSTNSQVTISATSNLKIGVAAAAAANTDATASVHLNASF